MTLYAKLVGGGRLLIVISVVKLKPFITSKYLTFGNDISGCITSTTQQSPIPLYFSLWLLQWIMTLDLQLFISFSLCPHTSAGDLHLYPVSVKTQSGEKLELQVSKSTACIFTPLWINKNAGPCMNLVVTF
jgi:hypothetical protein